MADIDEMSAGNGLEIAVVGISGRFPAARNIKEFWENIKNGVESMCFFSHEELEEAGVEEELLNHPDYVKANAILEDIEYFDAFFFGYTPGEALVMEPQNRLFHECAWEALEDAGCNPATNKALIGVYAGAIENMNWQARILSSDSSSGDLFSASVLGSKDFLTTQLSYKLNLKGPSITVFTGCSTALVVIHMACRALLSGECDLAIAGGASLFIPQKRGHIYQDQMIFSKDGHIRAFDAEASGTMFGSGIGVVVLKSLEDAMADRNNIYAIVKGSAINNDGNRKVSFTAPSVKGQVEVIRAAHWAAEVKPESIGYIEAHGTGTSLGDSIEMEALKQAFNTRTNASHSCAIGTVKPNVGHLDCAAGAAGFIKTVLALKHRLIPPSLNYKTPNPKMDFHGTPFYINTTLKEWENNGCPLRAGVSSFGFGGTNAHMILEEWPGARGAERKAQSARDYHLILFSAKTETALERMTQKLAEHFKKNPTINLADAAYTLQVGRSSFKHRKILVSLTAAEAVDALLASDSGRVHTFSPHRESRSLVFMFPGQGSQYVNMGLELYQAEPVFRQEMDHCFEILTPLMGYDPKEILYPHSDCRGGSLCPSNDCVGSPGQGDHRGWRLQSDRINQTEIAQPVIFTFEYALARWLMKWGIEPQAMIGHSIGEYVAACLAGVFTLEDALRLVSWRGKLMQQMPGGSMLAVPLCEKELTLRLNQELSVATVNGPSSCVVSGSHQLIDLLAEELKKQGHNTTRLHTSHAFHSTMMDPIINKFEEKVRETRLNQSGINFLSNVTGKWITIEEATNPVYWSNHLRKTVRFYDGLSELLKRDNSIFIEVGPGKVLSTLVKQHPDKKVNQQALNLVRHPKETISDQEYLTEKLGLLWLYGEAIDWEKYHEGEKRYLISLPTYSFDRRRFWLEGDTTQMGKEILFTQSLSGRKNDKAEGCYIPQWNRSVLQIEGDKDLFETPSCWLVFMDEPAEGLGMSLVERLKADHHHIMIARPGLTFKVLNEHEYILNPDEGNDYDRLFKELLKTGNVPGKIVYLWELMENETHQLTIEETERIQDLGFYRLVNIAEAIKANGISSPIQLEVVTSGVQEVTGEENLYPLNAAILGAVHAIPLQNSHIRCRSIDIVPPGADSHKPDKIVTHLLREFLTAAPETQVVAYRGNYRWIQTFESIKLNKVPLKTQRLKDEGGYLVTGGLGDIGFTLAGHLAQTRKARLILVDVLDFPARKEWDDWLAADDMDSKDKDKDFQVKIQKINQWEKQGASIHLHRADISNYQQVKAIISEVETCFGKINGVIHTHPLRPMDTAGTFLTTRLKEIWVLDELLKRHQLDFMVIFSSGGSGLNKRKFSDASRLAGHELLNAFSRYKQKEGTFAVTIDWNNMNGKGTAVSSLEIIEVFNRIIETDFFQVTVFTPDLEKKSKWMEQTKEGEPVTVGSLQEVTGTAVIPGKRELTNAYAAPKNEIEQKLVNIWKNFFGVETVRTNDDFFELGGDSLKALSLTSRIHKEFNVLVPLTEMFNAPTVISLSKYIKGAKQDKFGWIEVVEEKEYYPLSSAQKRLYILHQIDAGSPVYNLPIVALLEGELKKEQLEDTFGKLIKRHEILRTSFELAKEEPIQRIHRQVKFEIAYYDLTAKTTKEREKELAASAINDFIRPFNLSQAPLFRVGFIKQEEQKHMLMVDMHHIISDGTSLNVLVKEFMVIYGGEELPDQRIRYKDFTEWRNSKYEKEKIEQQEGYWMKQFAGDIPVLNLPYDYSRPPIQSFAGNTIPFEIDEKETGELKQLASQRKVTLYMVLISIINILFSKISGQEDIVIGTPVAGRIHHDIEQVIGMFINTLSLRYKPGGEKSFTGFLEDVKKCTLAGFENQDYQFEDLVGKVVVNRDVSRNPLFDVMFILQNMEGTHMEIPGLKLSPYEYENKTVQFDLIFDTLEANNKIHFKCEYSTKLFKQETIERFIHYFKKIVSIVIQKPETTLGEIEILSVREKHRLLVDFNETTVVYPRDKTLHELFEMQVERTPDHTALIGQIPNSKSQIPNPAARGPYKEVPFGQEGARGLVPLSITYKELNERSNQWVRFLRTKGVGAGTIVGLLLERSPDMILGILTIIKAGGAYLPLDPDYPPERIKYILDDSNTAIIITSQQFKQFVEEGYEIIEIEDTGIYGETGDNWEKMGKPTDSVYVIYTSGSTGRPKGVMIEHRPLINFIKGITDIIDFSRRDIVLSLTTISFDIFGLETILPLTKGSRVIIGTREEQLNPAAAVYTMLEKDVTIFQVTPSRLLMLTSNQESSRALKSLKYLLVGGEAFPGQLLEMVREITGGKIYNLYGPTETTIWSTVKEVTKGKALNIGKPIANTRIYILDKKRILQPLGVVGELYIAGDGLARGYLNHPRLTKEKFVADPFFKEKRMYFTGDLASWLPDGNIEFLGRIDHQVKIRGFRIELGEIESCLLSHDEVKEAVVLASQVSREKNTEVGHQELYAYIVSDIRLTVVQLKDYLNTKLPDYMIPSHFVPMEKIPVTPNGKIDRKILESYDTKLGTGVNFVPPESETEQVIANTLKEVLKIDKVSIHDNFFDIGGHSLSMIKICSKINELFKKDLQVVDLFRFSTIHTLSQHLNQEKLEDDFPDENIKEAVDMMEEAMQMFVGGENE